MASLSRQLARWIIGLRYEDLNGRPFAFSDATSTSGYIFPFNLLASASVKLGHVYYAGGHANVVQAVADGMT